MVQVVTGCCDGGSFMNNAQHITMCGLFLCNGLADLAVRDYLETKFMALLTIVLSASKYLLREHLAILLFYWLSLLSFP